MKELCFTIKINRKYTKRSKKSERGKKNSHRKKIRREKKNSRGVEIEKKKERKKKQLEKNSFGSKKSKKKRACLNQTRARAIEGDKLRQCSLVLPKAWAKRLRN